MSNLKFFDDPAPLSVGEIAGLIKAELHGSQNHMVNGIGPLDQAGPMDLSFLDNPSYLNDFIHTKAGACIVAPKFVARAPKELTLLVSAQPYRAFATVAAHMFPAAMRPESVFGGRGVSSGAIIHHDARIEADVQVDPGVVIGAGAEIGRGTTICANAVIGPGVRIGRDCAIGPSATLVHAFIGNRVIVHAGCRLGQDGFGFAMGPSGHQKMPQIGRVIIQDDVEIGAGTCIDRGANRDTIVGEGTKIDNLVQIGHNVVIGRHCVIVAQTGISGSAILDDFVVLGGQVGVVGHVRIGMGAQIAGSSNVREDVPAGSRWGGTPAKPYREWFREITTLKRMANQGKKTEAELDADQKMGGGQ